MEPPFHNHRRSFLNTIQSGLSKLRKTAGVCGKRMSRRRLFARGCGKPLKLSTRGDRAARLGSASQ